MQRGSLDMAILSCCGPLGGAAGAGTPEVHTTIPGATQSAMAVRGVGNCGKA